MQQTSTQGRTAHTKPQIQESYVDDDFNVVHILTNGREMLADKYTELWEPKKGVINWKGRGDNPDKRRQLK